MDKKSRKENKKVVTSIRKDNKEFMPNRAVRKAKAKQEIAMHEKLAGKSIPSHMKKEYKKQY